MTNTNYRNKARSVLDGMTDAQKASAAHYFFGRLCDRISENDINYLKHIIARDSLAEEAGE